MNPLFEFLEAYLPTHPLKGEKKFVVLRDIFNENQDQCEVQPTLLVVHAKKYVFWKEVLDNVFCLEDNDGCCLDATGVILDNQNTPQGTMKAWLKDQGYREHKIRKIPLASSTALNGALSEQQQRWKDAFDIEWTRFKLDQTLPISPTSNRAPRL